MGRVDAWVINTKFALENPLTGAGLRNPYREDLAKKVDAERAPRAKAGHSIYFEVLGGTGFVGFFIYMAMLASGFFMAHALSREKRNHDTPRWIRRLAYYLQISLAVFAIGGASASMERLSPPLRIWRQKAHANAAMFWKACAGINGGCAGPGNPPWRLIGNNSSCAYFDAASAGA